MNFTFQFTKELIVVGLQTIIVGLIVTYIAMRIVDPKTKFKHWTSVAVTFFITGALIHFINEWMGWNAWYCKHGNVANQ